MQPSLVPPPVPDRAHPVGALAGDALRPPRRPTGGVGAVDRAIPRGRRKLAQQMLTRSSAVAQWARLLADVARRPALDWAPPALQEGLEPALQRLGANV